MEWFENLPENCPPEDAYSPQEEVFYRRVTVFPVEEKDFEVYKTIKEGQNFGSKECMAHAVSVSNDLEKTLYSLTFPIYAGQKVAKIILNPKDGVVKKTGKAEDHYSWWRAKSFSLNTIKEAKVSNES